MQSAYYCYARWGAKAKTETLEKRYPQLLSPILERETLSLSKSSTIVSLTTGTVSKTTTGIGSLLDLGTIMKAARSLSEEIELEGAIANLMKVVQENAGAQTVALMLCEEQVLTLVAQVTDSDRLSTSNPVPEMIINQVKRSRQPVLLDNASQENAYAGDAYIQQHQPRSILCLPLVNRGQLIGILYLENNHVTGAFTSDRAEVLSLLCSQAAISLENARLYQQAQQALTDLQKTQLQLVNSEKMSALGSLVAGVAHEINNPTGFLQGNIQPAQEYLQDLLELIEVYESEYPQPNQVIQEKIEDIELEFVRKDFPELLESMNLGVERIRNISKSLRTFSRKDEEHKTQFKIDEGIESTLLILKHRTKASEQRPALEIVKDYQDIPEVQCFPGQLNQVFMNIMANAIDAFDEANVGKSYDEIKANPNQITISISQLDETRVQIQIQDNGCGMKPETQARIFEQGFTTKGVGKGTGLGMAIARQIVQEKHGGTITCDSELGKGTTFTITLPISG
jgi:signal transduction histidine kinase